MQHVELSGLFEQMHDEGEVYPHVLMATYKAMLCRSAEAIMVSTGSIIAAVGTLPEEGLQLDSPVGPVQVTVPPSPSEHHRALLLQTPEAAYVAVLEFGSKPDALSRSMAQMIAEHQGKVFDAAAFEAADRAERAARADVITQITVCRVQEPLERLLPRIIADEYVREAMFESRQSHPKFEQPGLWDAYGQENHDLDGWLTFFPAMATTMRHCGLDAAFAAEMAAFRERVYPSLEGFPSLAAAETLGWRLAQEDGFLPGAAARAALLRLETWQAERALQLRLATIQGLHARCTELGFVSEGTAFAHNDIDNHLHAPAATGHSGVDHLVLRDQNRTFLAMLFRGEDGQPGTLTVLHGGPDAPLTKAGMGLLASFSIAPGGVVQAQAGPGLKQDSIRAWNSFLLDIETAECCLNEDHPRPGSPAPR